MKEQSFYRLWTEVAAGQEPFEMARLGGEQAESPGQIFISGYQAAIRQTFPELDQPGWWAFAVTEDRAPDSALPGVTLTNGKVSGVKTWIAAANCVDVLVLKVGSGARAVYGWVRVDEPGVGINLRQGRFLADMSQGSAEFERANFHEFTNVSKVQEFRHSEPYYIYIAFLGKLASQDSDPAESGLQNQAYREMALSALMQQAVQADLKALDSTVTRLLDMMSEEGIVIGDNWEADKRLFTMYSKGIQA